MLDKKGIIGLNGFSIRLLGAIFITTSTPFLVASPSNTYTIISFVFGNFLMVLGGLIP